MPDKDFVRTDERRTEMTIKPILDATCGSRMIWFDKKNPGVLYVDRREVDDKAIWKSGNGKSVRYLSVHPDVIADFTDMPFEDNSFYHVVFDPPHLTSIGDSAWMTKKYGKLPKYGWENIVHDGFWECMRVLKPYGTLIFKWNEFDIPVKDVIKAIGCDPLYGNRSGKKSKTHWMSFVKCVSDANRKAEEGDQA